MLTKKDITKRDLAKLVIQRLDGARIEDSTYFNWLLDCVKRGIGGFIVFGGKRESLRRYISCLQSEAEGQLFIASDIEWGLARQIEDTTRFPCQMALASALYPDDESLLIDALACIAQECLYVGINMPLIPVLDVNCNPDNPIISTRAFSDKPEVVAWFAERYTKVFSKHGLIIAGKHFPGHGDTSVDSHIDMPVINKTAAELMEWDIAPFMRAIDFGIGCLMVGHLQIPSLDDQYPASLSRRIITNLLRDKMGFQGLVITDAMNMKALRHYDDIYAKCIMAGADIILHPDNFDDCLVELELNLDRGQVTAEAIDRALNNIKGAKSLLSSINTAPVDFNAHAVIAASIYARSITAIKSEEGLLPLESQGQYDLYILGEFNRYDITVLTAGFRGRVFFDVSALRNANCPIVVALFTTVSAWHGTSGISSEVRSAVTELIKGAQKSILISFGSPYILRFFPKAHALISAYEPSAEAQRNVIDCLYGRGSLNDNLPVDIEFLELGK